LYFPDEKEKEKEMKAKRNSSNFYLSHPCLF